MLKTMISPREPQTFSSWSTTAAVTVSELPHAKKGHIRVHLVQKDFLDRQQTRY
jgi:hypothetical protein